MNRETYLDARCRGNLVPPTMYLYNIYSLYCVDKHLTPIPPQVFQIHLQNWIKMFGFPGMTVFSLFDIKFEIIYLFDKHRNLIRVC